VGRGGARVSECTGGWWSCGVWGPGSSGAREVWMVLRAGSVGLAFRGMREWPVARGPWPVARGCGMRPICRMPRSRQRTTSSGSASRIGYPAFGTPIGHSLFPIPHSSFLIPQSAPGTRHSAFGTRACRAVLGTNCWVSGALHRASPIQHPPSSSQHPASSIQHPAFWTRAREQTGRKTLS
jgi:hypothetical protein